MTEEQHDALKVGDKVWFKTWDLEGFSGQVVRTHQGDPPCIMVIRPEWLSPRGFWPHELEVA